MIFDANNRTDKGRVFDVEANSEIRQVLEIDTTAGTVTFALEPLRLAPGSDQIASETIQFETIHPIYGGGRRPCLFHCYGRAKPEQSHAAVWGRVLNQLEAFRA